MSDTLTRPQASVDTLTEISKYIDTSKYAQYLPDLKRRELWPEAVERVEDMHLRKYAESGPEVEEAIRWAFSLVHDKRALPSMRSMQFGGRAVEAANARMFNCAVRHIDSLRSFSEVFYLLLCGCGVGMGITDRYLDRLPDLVSADDKTGTVMTYVVEDSIEGWADSLEALLMCYFVNTPFSGRRIIFDYSKIREKGALLKTGGGKAPGFRPLKAAHAAIKSLLDEAIEVDHQRRLLTINAYDINMFSAEAVLAGGVRRSATSVVFAKDDKLMMNAKSGAWYDENPQRSRSNNSVLLMRDEVTAEELADIMAITREWGEPGFVFADHPDTLFNPCFEISFIPMTDDGVCGVQFCNLTTINGAKIKSLDDYLETARAASIIGTLQAGYTSFPYLGHVAEHLTEDEALLGVSITGQLENPDILCNPEYQRLAAQVAVETNEWLAELIGVNPAARVTTQKPEGTSSLSAGTMASGNGAAHAYVMWRRVQANRDEAPYQLFKSVNPHLCSTSSFAPDTDDVITFPIRVPDSAIVKADLSALEHLAIIRNNKENWVDAGTTRHNRKPLTHNVSCTVIVKPDEWDGVTDYIYEHRGSFAAVALLASSGDKDYAQAPMEAVVTAEELELWQSQMDAFIPVDYSFVVELKDGTNVLSEASCVGGACEVV